MGGRCTPGQAGSSRFDVVLLGPSGDLNGSSTLHGSAEQIAALREAEAVSATARLTASADSRRLSAKLKSVTNEAIGSGQDGASIRTSIAARASPTTLDHLTRRIRRRAQVACSGCAGERAPRLPSPRVLVRRLGAVASATDHHAPGSGLCARRARRGGVASGLPGRMHVVHIVRVGNAGDDKGSCRGAQVVDADRRLGGDLHAAARHHRRQRRAARHPALAALELLRPAVGRQRLLADARRVPADRRRARRPLRAAARVRHRARRLHRSPPPPAGSPARRWR